MVMVMVEKHVSCWISQRYTDGGSTQQNIQVSKSALQWTELFRQLFWVNPAIKLCRAAKATCLHPVFHCITYL